MKNEQYWQNILTTWKDELASINYFIRNFYLPDNINIDIFINNLSADYLLYNLVLSKLNKCDVIDTSSFPIYRVHFHMHWNYYEGIRYDKKLLLEKIPGTIYESIVTKYAFQHCDFKDSTDGYVTDEIEHLPIPSPSFEKYFNEPNEYRSEQGMYNWSRYWIIAYPDVVSWYYEVCLHEEELKEYIKQLFKSPLAKPPGMAEGCISGDTFRKIIELYQSQTGLQLECSDNFLN